MAAFFILMVISISFPSVKASSKLPQSQMRLNMGTAFMATDFFHVVVEGWNHIFVIGLPHVNLVPVTNVTHVNCSELSRRPNELHNCELSMSLVKALYNSHVLTTRAVHKLITEIDEMLPKF